MNNKKEIRNEVLKLLKESGFPSSFEVEGIITQLRCYQEASDIFAYYPFSNEIDIKGVIDQALRDDKRVWLPVTLGEHKMRFSRVAGDNWKDTLKRAVNKTKCPTSGQYADLQSLGKTLVIIPGLAFDSQNHRLGRGGGYYDAFLASIKDDKRFFRLGVCLPEQIVDFDVEEHDQVLDEVLVIKKA